MVECVYYYLLSNSLPLVVFVFVFVCYFVLGLGYVVTSVWMEDCWKEGNVLFNNALNIFYLRLYGVRHMVKDHSDSERGNLLPPHGLLFPLSSKDSLNAYFI